MIPALGFRPKLQEAPGSNPGQALGFLSFFLLFTPVEGQQFYGLRVFLFFLTADALDMLRL